MLGDDCVTDPSEEEGGRATTPEGVARDPFGFHGGTRGLKLEPLNERGRGDGIDAANGGHEEWSVW